MAIKPDYQAGTASITAGATDLVGAGGANWLAADIQPGDTFKVQNLDAIVASVNSATSITLAAPWTGTTLAASPYRIRYQPDGSRFTAALRDLVAAIGGGSIAALQALTGAADKIPYFTGPGAMALADFKAWARSFFSLTPAADKLVYFASATTTALIDFKSWARDFLSAPDIAAARKVLGAAGVGEYNLCFNPGAQVWQNDLVLPSMAHRTVLADGFLFGTAGGGAIFTGGRSTNVPDISVPASISLSCTTAETPMAAGSEKHIRYVVLGQKLLPYQNSNIKVRFWVRSSKVGIHSVAAINQARTSTYICEYTVTAVNTWEEKEVTIPMGSKIGTWNFGSDYGLGLRWCLGTGSTFAGSPNAWLSGNYSGSINQVNLGDTVGNEFRVTKIQIYPESVPAFTLPDYDQVLSEAFRQYRVLTTDVAGLNVAYSAASTTQAVNADLILSPPMYVPPSISFKGTLNTDIVLQDYAGGLFNVVTLQSFARSKDYAKFTMDTGAPILVAGRWYNIRLATTAGKIVIDGHLS